MKQRQVFGLDVAETGRRLHAWARSNPLIAWLMAASFASLFCMAFLDRPIAEHFAHDARPEVYTTFKYLSALGNAVPYLVAALLLAVGARVASSFTAFEETRAKLRRLMDAGVFVILTLAVSGALLNIMKIVIGRQRPEAWIDDGNPVFMIPFSLDFGMNAFPSGHTQVAFAVAASLVLIYPRYDLAYIGVACVIGFSRIATYDHYVSDVVFSVWLSSATAIMVKRWVYDRRGLSVRVADWPPDPAVDTRQATNVVPDAVDRDREVG